MTKRMYLKRSAVVCCIILLALVSAGCTSNAGTTTPVTTAAIPAESGPGSITTQQVSSQNQVPTTVISASQATPGVTQPQEDVSLTINSAKKVTKLFTMTPKTGRIFLVLDITVKNNGIEKGLDFNDQSVRLLDIKNNEGQSTSLTTTVRGGLENPIITPTRIDQKATRSGEIVFGVLESSGSFRISVIDNGGDVVSSQVITADKIK
jgi:hypothetical protein